jgi:hypothetical protein
VSATELEAAKREAAKLAEMIKGYQEEAKTGLSNVEAKMAALEAQQQKLTQAQDALNRASFDRSTVGVGNREIDTYTRAAEHELADGSGVGRCYLASKEHRSVVRLVGHDRMGDPQDPRSVYRVHGLFDDPNPRTEWQRRAQQLLDRRNFVTAVLNVGVDRNEPKRRAWRCEAELIDHMRSGPDGVAKIFADASGQGAAWIPDNPLPELEREVLYRPSRWQIFNQVTMTRNPLLRPFKSGYIRAYKSQIPTSDDPAADPLLGSFTPSSDTIGAEEVAAGAQVHMNAEEDAIVSFEGEIRSDLVDGTVFAIENAITNGDSAATHQDAIHLWDTRGRLNGTTGLGGSNDQRRLWLGQRALAYDLTSMTTDAAGAALTTAMILADLAKIKVESLLGSQGRVGVVIEVSPETFFSTLINLAEFDAFDNVGVLASVLTGQLGDLSKTPGGLLPGQVGFLWGRFPVVVNYTITKDLAATGLFTTGVATLTGTLTYDASRFQTFLLRGSMVKVAEDIRNNTKTLVSRTRMKWHPKDAVSSSNKSCHWRYNVLN